MITKPGLWVWMAMLQIWWYLSGNIIRYYERITYIISKLMPFRANWKRRPSETGFRKWIFWEAEGSCRVRPCQGLLRGENREKAMVLRQEWGWSRHLVVWFLTGLAMVDTNGYLLMNFWHFYPLSQLIAVAICRIDTVQIGLNWPMTAPNHLFLRL